MKKISTYITFMLLCVVIPASAEDTLLLRTINFERNSAEIPQSSFEALDKIAALFNQISELRYEIHGHSDSIGSEEYNELLSNERADAVKDYIISKGVPAEKIIATGYGMAKPIVSNSDSSDHASNRRVETLLIEPVAVPEPEPITEIAEPEPCPQTECEACSQTECETCQNIQPATRQKSGMSIGIGGFFSNDFGGGFKTSEINIKNIKIPSAETKTPWINGGIKVFFDAVYAEIGVGLAFGSATMETDNQIEVDWSFMTLNLSLLGKYPIELYNDISLFPAAGIDYRIVLSGKLGNTDIADASDNNALWFKFGTGMDIAVNEDIFIRPMLLYGFRPANKWENDAVKPVIKGVKEGATRLGHGFTISIGVGFNI